MTRKPSPELEAEFLWRFRALSPANKAVATAAIREMVWQHVIRAPSAQPPRRRKRERAA